jgi:hypothetical protein
VSKLEIYSYGFSFSHNIYRPMFDIASDCYKYSAAMCVSIFSVYNFVTGGEELTIKEGVIKMCFSDTDQMMVC